MKRPSRSAIAAVCMTALFTLSLSELATPEPADAQMRGAHRRGGSAHRGGGRGPGGPDGPDARGRDPGPGRVGNPSSRHAYRAGSRHGYRHGYHHGWAARGPTIWRWHPIGWGLVALATTAIVVAIVSDDGGTQTTTSAASASDSDAPGTIYYDEGTYYEKRADGTYKVVPPPPGATVSDLPQGYTSIWVAQDQYFYYQGQYYAEKDGKYVAAAAPVGAAVPYLPDDAEEKTEGGTTYYVWQDEYYVEVSQNGETQYMLTKVGSGQASRLNPATEAAPAVAARASPGGRNPHPRQDAWSRSPQCLISTPA